MRGAIPRAQNLRFATVSRDRPTGSYERVHPAKSKCVFRYSGVPSKMSKCTFRYSGVRKNVWNERMASAVARGIQKLSFHHSFERPTIARSDERVPRRAQKFPFHQFWPSDEHEVTRRLLRAARKFAFHHSFGRPTNTKWREGCFGQLEICISQLFLPSDEHEVTRGLLRQRETCISSQFNGHPTSTKWQEGCLPPRSTKPTPRQKMKKF